MSHNDLMNLLDQFEKARSLPIETIQQHPINEQEIARKICSKLIEENLLPLPESIKQKLSLIEAVLSFDADLEAKDFVARRIKCLDILISQIHQKEWQEKSGNILYLAIVSGSLEIVRFLVEEKKVDMSDALPYALDCVRFHHINGSQNNIEYHNHVSILEYIAQVTPYNPNDKDMVNVLEELVAFQDINQKLQAKNDMQYIQKSFHSITQPKNHEQLISCILKYPGFEKNPQSFYHKWQNRLIVNSFLELASQYIGDINKPSILTKEILLIEAMLCENSDVIEALLAHPNVNLNVKDKKETSFLTFIIFKRAFIKNSKSSISHSISQRNILSSEIIKKIIAHPTICANQEHHGKIPLFYALIHQDILILTELLKQPKINGCLKLEQAKELINTAWDIKNIPTNVLQKITIKVYRDQPEALQDFWNNKKFVRFIMQNFDQLELGINEKDDLLKKFEGNYKPVYRLVDTDHWRLRLKLYQIRLRDISHQQEFLCDKNDINKSPKNNIPCLQEQNTINKPKPASAFNGAVFTI